MVSLRIAALALLLAACGGSHGSTGDGGTDAGSCPNLNPFCPDAGPPSWTPSVSWSTQVQPIVEQSCLPCHTPGHQPYSGSDLDGYAAVEQIHGTVLLELYTCAMPNGDGGPGFVLDGGPVTLSQANRLTIMDWCLCGAPNN